MGKCRLCQKEALTISDVIGYCYDCLRKHWDELKEEIFDLHAHSRLSFDLPPYVPKEKEGIECKLCINACRIKIGEVGFCGVKKNVNNRITGGIIKGNLQFYYDPLPTNCVADWVCPGGTGAGYPKYAYSDGPEFGYYNLAVFYQACNFNCLYCQNFSHKDGFKYPHWVTVEELTEAALKRNVSCVCYFGGDPTPQIIHALAVSKNILKRKKSILRICFETNGAVNPKILKQMAEISLESGGCIKFDLKAWHEEIHLTLCGVSNKQTLENFKWLASLIPKRPQPPFLIASTLLVPGYVDVDEVKKIANFIAKLNPNIPYSLLAFYPTFILKDLPTTSYSHATRCFEVAKEAGIKRVKIGNKHLLGKAYE